MNMKVDGARKIVKNSFQKACTARFAVS